MKRQHAFAVQPLIFNYNSGLKAISIPRWRLWLANLQKHALWHLFHCTPRASLSWFTFCSNKGGTRTRGGGTFPEKTVYNEKCSKFYDTQGHSIMSVTSPIPLIWISGERTERGNYKTKFALLKWTDIIQHLGLLSPSAVPSWEMTVHVQKSNFGTSKTFYHLIKSMQTRSNDDVFLFFFFLNHFTRKWTKLNAHSQSS